jgi:hypothetical protein
MVINPARIDHPKTASGHESSFSLTRQAQTNHYDRRMFETHLSTPISQTFALIAGDCNTTEILLTPC